MSMRYLDFMYWRGITRKGDLSYMLRGNYPKRSPTNRFTRLAGGQRERKQMRREYARATAFELRLTNKQLN